MFHFSKILVLSPHPDDAELGAGGTIARLADEGREIYYIAFSGCERSIAKEFSQDILNEECQRSTKILGVSTDNLTLLGYEVRTFPSYRQDILEELIKFNAKIRPDLVLIPSSSDTHQDHQTIHNEALRAFKKTSSIWGYEHPWNNLTFTTDIFVNLEKKHTESKVKALEQYKSQDFRPYFDERYISALAYTRGTQVDFKYAEAFELVRLLVK